MSGSSSRRGLLIGLGAIFIVGGIVAAVVLWNAGTQRRTSAIENLARAPLGCDTTLDFAETGEYLLFLETRGELDGVRGNCDVEGSYEAEGVETSTLAVTIVDPDDNVLDLDRAGSDVSYDGAGFAGSAVFSVDIDTPDDHVMRVEADSDQVVVVAVGRDPNDGVAALRGGAIGAGVLGLVVGLGLVLAGARRRAATVTAGAWSPAVPGQPFTPGGQPPQGPPIYGQQAGPPQYTAPQPQAPQYAQPQQPPYPQPGQAPQYQQPYPQQPAAPPSPYGQPQQAPPPAPPPAPSVPSWDQAPQIPGQPPMPSSVPADPAASAQPVDWAPQEVAPPPPSNETAPPDADFLAQLRNDRDEVVDDRATQERPPPPPPS